MSAHLRGIGVTSTNNLYLLVLSANNVMAAGLAHVQLALHAGMALAMAAALIYPAREAARRRRRPALARQKAA